MHSRHMGALFGTLTDGSTVCQPYMPVIGCKPLWLHGACPRPDSMLRMQGVGRVVRNGPRASKFSEGMRVVAAPWPAGTPSGAQTLNP